MKDPKKLRDQRPDYVKDPNASGDPDRLPVIGGDPEDPTPGGAGEHVAPDPEEGDEKDDRR